MNPDQQWLPPNLSVPPPNYPVPPPVLPHNFSFPPPNFFVPPPNFSVPPPNFSSNHQMISIQYQRILYQNHGVSPPQFPPFYQGQSTPNQLQFNQPLPTPVPQCPQSLQYATRFQPLPMPPRPRVSCTVLHPPPHQAPHNEPVLSFGTLNSEQCVEEAAPETATKRSSRRLALKAQGKENTIDDQAVEYRQEPSSDGDDEVETAASSNSKTRVVPVKPSALREQTNRHRPTANNDLELLDRKKNKLVSLRPSASKKQKINMASSSSSVAQMNTKNTQQTEPNFSHQ